MPTDWFKFIGGGGAKGPKGDPGPAPSGGNDGDLITRVSGAPAWNSPAAILAAAGIPEFRSGAIVAPATGASVEGARYTPGANKAGRISLHARGRTDAPGDVIVYDEVGFVTDGSGQVYLQCTTPGGGAFPPAPGGLGAPGQPTGLDVVVNGQNVTVSWTNGGGGIGGTYLEVSDDGGATWTVPDVSKGGGLVANGQATSVVWTDAPQSGAAFKVRVRHFNDFGDSPSSAVVDSQYATPSPGGGGGGGGNNVQLIPIFPCAKVGYTDANLYFLGFSTPNGTPPTVTFFVEPQAGDIVLRAQAIFGHKAGIGFTAQITVGADAP